MSRVIWPDGTVVGSRHPSFNTPRKSTIVLSGIPLGVAMANASEGDVVPVSTDYGMKAGVVAGNTIRAGEFVTIDANGRVVPCNNNRKEGNLPKYTSVTTKPSGFIFRITAKIPHPTLEKLVMIPIEGDLFTVERNDEWNVGDEAMYIAPGQHFCGDGIGTVYPAVAFLFGGNRGCQNVYTRFFAGAPSRGFLTKPPKDYPRTASPAVVFACWESEQREAAKAAKAAADALARAAEATKKAEEATKKLEAEFKAAKEASIADIADAVGKDARQRYIDRANGKKSFGTIRLVALPGGKLRLEYGREGGWLWKPLDHINVTATMKMDLYLGEEAREIARW